MPPETSEPMRAARPEPCTEPGATALFRALSPTLLSALERAEGASRDGDVGSLRSALAQFDLALRQLGADDLSDDVARELHARIGNLAAFLGAARDQVLAELTVARRAQAYGADGPRAGRRIEGRA